MNLIKIYIIFTFLLCTSLLSHETELNLTQKEIDWIKKHPVIKVSNDDWAPFDYSKGGIAHGYSVEVIIKLAKKAGLKVEFVNGYSWSELLEKFDNHEIDLMHVMAWNEERGKKYIYSEPYMPWNSSFIVRDNTTKFDFSSGLDGKKIGTGKDWSTVNELKKLYPNAKILEYKNTLEILQALSTGKIDIAVDNIVAAKYIMGENFLTNLKHSQYLKAKNSKSNYLYFVANQNNPELISIFNKAFETLNTDEKLKLQKRYLSDGHERLITLSDEEEVYLHNKKVIKMCIDPNWMPFEKFDINGDHIGMTAEYFKIFEQKIGIPIKVIKTNTWTESIDAAKKRKCDIYSLAMQTPERKEYMNFTSPYLSFPLVLATKLDVPFINDVRYIENKRVGITKGYAFNEIIRKEYPNIKVVDVKDINDGLQKVANGELFGFIGTLASVGYVFQNSFMGELKISGKFDEFWELGIGARNDEPLLVGIFEKAINSLSAKKHQSILNRYIAIKYEKATDYELLIKVLIAVSIILFIGLYFYRRLTIVNKKLKKLQKELVEQANRDPMTNLYNRRYFHSVATDLMKIAKREKTNIGIIILDIDNFKLINDRYGHAIGDDVIKMLAKLLLQNTRESDIVARFGGEEFVMLLPNTNKSSAFKIASKLREKVEKETLEVENDVDISFTISLGVSDVSVDDDRIDLSINRADKALYKAKNSGRNNVVSS